MAKLIFDKYESIKRIAVGGMGEVFLARQTGLGGLERLVILKSLLPQLAEAEEQIKQFLDEARVAATLNHPNIVSIYEVGAWEGTYYIAMEFIPGKNLSQLARACGGKVPVPVAVRVAHDTALALDYAHHAIDVYGNPLMLVHRDISPQNVMVRRDGLTKVVDFGIARVANRESRTATGLVKGKLAYMAPEQVTGGVIDGRTDEWALGVVLWELVTGRRLFHATSDLELARAVTLAPIAEPKSHLPELPDEVNEAVMRMLQREPGRRFQRCAEVARDLSRYLAAHAAESDALAVATHYASVFPTETGEEVLKSPSPVPNFLISLSPSPTPRSAAPDTPTKSAVRPVGGARERRSRGSLLLLLLVLVMLGGAGGAAVAFRPELFSSPVVELPDAGAPVAAVVPVVEPPPPAPAPAPPPPMVETPVPEAPHRPKTAGGKRARRDAGTAEAVQANGKLTLSCDPWAIAWVDEERWGDTPIVDRSLPAGRHRLRLENAQYGVDQSRDFVITAGQTLRLNVKLTGAGER